MRYPGAVKQFVRLAAAALGLAAVAVAMQPHAATAQDRPAGLVMEREGAATPDVAPFTELMPRSTIELSTGSRMSFIHYGTCRLVTVEGGRLYVDAQRYSVAAGRIAGAEPTDCPREQKLAQSGDTVVAAVLVMRGASGSPRLRAHPRIVLTGSYGVTFTVAELRHEGRTLGPMTVRGHMAAWPETNPPLTPGQGYVARLKTADGKRTLDFEFSVAEPGAPSDAAAILRID
jgi:hypothetical protein